MNRTPHTPAQPAVELHNVEVAFDSESGPVQALNDVSLSCPPASSTSIIGRSGSGKSTLISVLALLRKPNRGEVSVAGTRISQLPEHERARLRAAQVGVVFQSFHLDYALSVEENVMLAWYFSKTGSRRAALNNATELLELLGISELARRRPHAMSGGQRQRVAIARALFSRPPVLLADEPTGNLDERTANDVASVLLNIPRELGTALILVTHDNAIAARADRRLELVEGRLGAAS